MNEDSLGNKFIEIYELTRLILINADNISNEVRNINHSTLKQRLDFEIDTIKADCLNLLEFITDLQQCETDSDIDFLLQEINPEEKNNG